MFRARRYVDTRIFCRASEGHDAMWGSGGPKDKLCRFYGGLHREIQDIIDYKYFNTAN
jgi:hypothetical protein